jgi:2-amino-4-hydroxy-6-hydroxymethyldihydropteridine diphosphokinase
MNKVYLLIGGNLDDRAAKLTQAANLIEEHIGRITKSSALYETSAWGAAKEGQAAFLNQIVYVTTTLRPKQILNFALEIEKQMGRKRTVKNADRIIDIDVIFVNNEIILGKGLNVPHPLMHERKFTLVPMVEIAANYVHPIFEKTMERLLSECTDTLDVEIYKP